MKYVLTFYINFAIFIKSNFMFLAIHSHNTDLYIDKHSLYFYSFIYKTTSMSLGTNKRLLIQIKSIKSIYKIYTFDVSEFHKIN